MVNETAWTRILRQAIHRLGSRQALAGFLGVKEAELLHWLSGEESPPLAVLEAVEGVTSNSLGGARIEKEA
jgi:DNA-binding transcriptional regulator YdaS (Cro superfamily)